MGSEVQPPGQMMQFLAAFDPRLELWADEVNASEASPFPGEAVAGRTTRMTVVPSGSGSSSTLYLKEQSGGYPGAGSTWAFRTDPGAGWAGWDPPTTCTHTEIADWDSGNVSTDNQYPTMVVDSNDEIIAAVEHRPSGTRTIYTALRETDGDWVLAASSVWSETVSTSEKCLWPCVVRMPDNRIRIYHLHYDDTRSIAQVWCWELEDGGVATTAADWELLSKACLDEPISTASSYYPSGLRVAVGRGQVMIAFSYGTGTTFTIDQWYSRDSGLNFSSVASVSTEGLNRFGLIYAQGAFILAHAANDPNSTDELLEVRSVANAATSLANVSGVTVRTTLTASVTNVECNLVADPAGYVWLYLNDDGSQKFQAWVSEDGGGTWSGADADRGRRLYGDKLVQHSAMVWWRDRVLHLHRTSSATTYDACLICDHLGGSTTITMPLSGWGAKQTDRASFTRTWTPYTDPGNVFTQNITGAPTSAFDGVGRWAVSTAAGEEYDLAAGGSSGGAEQGRAAAELINGLWKLIVRWTDATNTTGIRVEVAAGSPETIYVYDDEAGTLITSVAADLPADPVEIWAEVNDGAYTIWRRAWGSGTRTWTEVHSGTGLTSGVGTDSGVTFRVGDAGGGGTSSAELLMLCALRTSGTAVEKSCGYGLDDADVLGRPTTGRPAYAIDGVSIQAAGGPARKGDTWTIVRDALYAHEAAAWTSTYPSPRRRWRSLDTSQATLAWKISGGDPSRKLQPMWALALAWPTQKIAVSWYDGAAWGADITVSLFESITCTRYGTTLTPSSGSANTSGTFYPENALAGGYVVSGASGTGSCRKILRNTAGVLQASSSVTWRKCELTLEGVDGTEPSASSTWRIVPPKALLLLRAPDTMEGVRLRWSTDSNYRQTPDSYIEGKALLGPAVMLGDSHGQDAVWTYEVPREESTMRNGGRWSTSPAPAGRTLELSWQQSMELAAQVRGSALNASAAPDYMKTWSATSDASHSVGSMHSTIAALVQQWAGEGTPVLYGTYNRSDIPSSSTDIKLIRGEGWIVGTVDPQWTVEHGGHGEEQLSEAFRLGSLTIRELV